MTVGNKLLQRGLCDIQINACDEDRFFFSSGKKISSFAYHDTFNIFTGEINVACERLHCGNENEK